jgi:hypothetical protein
MLLLTSMCRERDTSFIHDIPLCLAVSESPVLGLGVSENINVMGDFEPTLLHVPIGQGSRSSTVQ